MINYYFRNENHIVEKKENIIYIIHTINLVILAIRNSMRPTDYFNTCISGLTKRMNCLYYYYYIIVGSVTIGIGLHLGGSAEIFSGELIIWFSLRIQTALHRNYMYDAN